MSLPTSELAQSRWPLQYQTVQAKPPERQRNFHKFCRDLNVHVGGSEKKRTLWGGPPFGVHPSGPIREIQVSTFQKLNCKFWRRSLNFFQFSPLWERSLKFSYCLKTKLVIVSRDHTPSGAWTWQKWEMARPEGGGGPNFGLVALWWCFNRQGAHFCSFLF